MRNRLIALPTVLGAVAVLSLVSVALSTLSRWASIGVQQCVPDGLLGGLGVHLALLRQDPACGDEALAIGGEPSQVLTVLVVIAVPALVLQMSGVVLGLGLWVKIRAVVQVIAALFTGRLVVLTRKVRLPQSLDLIVVQDLVPALSGVPVGAPSLRGPPARAI